MSTDEKLVAIQLPTKEFVDSIASPLDYGTLSPLKVIRNYYLDLLLLPFDAAGRGTGTFDDIYQYMEIRKAVEKARSADDLHLAQPQFDYLKKRVLEWNHWPLMVPEVVLSIRDQFQ